ncbi:type II secretion system F family protein [Lentisphaerota bacterium ZTH]|nr:type II secretion system F family protein [Lentisphaerota bacterium]WET06426.1 type II secretion system F family protein [Lentisphaerota bacterium ZTH]
MPQYLYTAMDANGQEKKGKIDAPNESAAAAALKKQHLFPTSITDPKGEKKGTKGKGKKGAKKKGGGLGDITIGTPVVKTKELTIFTRQLSILMSAGLPLIRSLRTLERQAKNPILKKILGQAAESVEGGSTFSEALSKHPKSFDKLYLNMIRAGEAAGAMEIILDRLAMFMEKAAKIAGKVKSAMIYPSVIMSVMILVTSGLMIFIVPNFKKIFIELLEGEPLPPLTQMVMKISDILKDQIYLVFIALFIIFVTYKLINKTAKGKHATDWVKYNLPLFGPIVSKTAIARFSRTLGTLMGSGVAVLSALSIVKETAGNEVVSNAIQKVHDAVKEGEGIAPPLGATGIFPQMVISMLEVGEETGKLPDMCEKIADTYEEEVDNAVGALTSMIEPLMIVMMAVVVGSIVVALFMPLAKIIEKLGG